MGDKADPISHLTLSQAVEQLMSEMERPEWMFLYFSGSGSSNNNKREYHSYFDTKYQTLKANFPVLYGQVIKYTFHDINNSGKGIELKQELMKMFEILERARKKEITKDQASDLVKEPQFEKRLYPTLQHLEDKRLSSSSSSSTKQAITNTPSSPNRQ